MILILLGMMAAGAAAVAFAGLLLSVIASIFIFLIICGLIAFRIMPASTVAAWHARLTAPGFKSMMLCTCTFAGIIICGSGFWLLNRILHWVSAPVAIAGGMLSGALAGITFGSVAYFLLRRLTKP